MYKPLLIVSLCKIENPDNLEVVATVMELEQCLPVHRYSVDISSYFGPSGILGSDGKQNAA